MIKSISGLYAIINTPADHGSTDYEITICEAALRGGAQVIQYRNKNKNDLQRKNIAKKLLSLCIDYQAVFLINDDLELCQSIQAHGVHLGQKDTAVHHARSTLGPEAIIGITCHNDTSLAKQAEQDGANYVAFGRFFPSTTKPNAPQANIETLTLAKQQLRIPIVAIGGITVHNAKPLIHAGADSIAVIHALFSSEYIIQSASEFTSLFTLESRKKKHSHIKYTETRHMTDFKTSQSLYERAQKVIPGGVNSPVRAFNGVGGTPVFFRRADGAYLFDEDNQSYIDYVGSWGPMLLGHNHVEIRNAVGKAIENGLSFGAPTEIEIEMAETICDIIPSIELVRMVSSGTEATMSAIRLARGYTGRDKIVKFEGCYHGHADSLLVKAGSGALTLGTPSSPGVPASLAEHTITLDFNDNDGVRAFFKKQGREIAAIIVEPVAGNMNCIPPAPGFLETLREVCNEHGSVLIFDEVMTGFRTALGGAQSVYNIKPDLTTLGKVIGAGMPVGAFGGKREIMEHIAPLGPVYQAGTLSGNPIAMTAGLAMLKAASQPGVFESITQKATALLSGLQKAADDAGIAFTTSQVGGMFGIFFTEQQDVTSFSAATACNADRFKQFFHLMLKQGVYFAPSAYETGFMSLAHSEADIEKTIEAAKKAFIELN